MQLTHRVFLTGLAGLPTAALGIAPADAQSMDLSITIPRQQVAEYHAPYVAVWLEQAGAPARTLSVWYDYDNRENGGKKWLTDLRSWWRTSGRAMNLPANGVSGATRPPGVQKLSVPTAAIKPGQYTLVIEAAREVGGHDVVRLPLSWPLRPGARVTGTGTSELGAVALAVR